MDSLSEGNNKNVEIETPDSRGGGGGGIQYSAMSYNPSELIKLNILSSCHGQEAITLDKIYQCAEAIKPEAISHENTRIASCSTTTSLDMELDSQEMDEIERITGKYTERYTRGNILINPASSYAIPRK